MTAVVAVLAGVAWALVAHTVVNALVLRRPPRARDATEVVEPVSVLVPARDEAARIGACVTALVAQRGLQDVEVLVLDDESADGTADAARTAGGNRVRVLAGAPTPPGWCGKPHACAQLAAAARGRVLVFVDADVVVSPDGVARAIAQLRRDGLALVSPYPRQLAVSPLERLVQPLLQWSWLTFLPLRLAERSRRGSLSVANGQLLVVDADVYHRAGGHTAIRDQVVEDIALARAVKRAGGRATVTDGTSLAQCRMYDGARAVVDGYAKWMWTVFGSTAGAIGVAALLLVLYVVPWLLVPWTAWAWVAAAAGPAGRLVGAVRTGGRLLPDPVLHPLSMLAFATIVAVSLSRHRRGRLVWKGRDVT